MENKPTAEEAREGFKRLREACKKTSDSIEKFDDKVQLAAESFAQILGDFEGSAVLHIQNGKVRKADVTRAYRFK